MNVSLRKTVSALQTPLILAVLLLLTLSGLTARMTGKLTASLARRNQVYLDDSITDTAHLMLPVGAAKAAADAVEGSTINIEAGAVFAKAGMSIEAGDILQPMLDYINIAWKVLLISMVYLVTAKSILVGTDAIATPLLIVSLFAFLISSLAAMILKSDHPVRQALQRVGSLFLLCSLLFLLIIPLTVTGSAYLSHHTTDPMREDVRVSFNKIGKVFSMDKFHATEELKDKAIVLKDKIVELGNYAKDAMADVAVAVCKLVAIKLLNGIVFPLASFAFLVWLVRGCLCPALGLSDRPLSADDFRLLSGWIGHPIAKPQSAPTQSHPETASLSN